MTDRLPDDIVQRALAQHAEDLRLAQEARSLRIHAIRDHLQQLGNCKLYVQSGHSEDSLFWTYCQYVDVEPNGTTPWLSQQLQQNPVLWAPRETPAFRWTGIVPAISTTEPVSVVVWGSYYDAHAGGW